MAKSSPYFWWVKSLDKAIWEPFWWVILMVVILIVPFLRVWWWILFPLILFVEVKKLYRWWVHWDYNYAKIKWTMLEIVPPKEILVPLKAMEDIFTVLWGPLYTPGNWREQWCEGNLAEGASWMSWEIASIEGQLHFYLRLQSSLRSVVESILYSHYPELEIHEVSDYTAGVPKNIPNEEWNVYGEDFVLGRKSPYPIKTYEKFFEPQGEKISAEEKRIDPLASLLEAISKLGVGEQFWVQFITISMMASEDQEFEKDHKSIINKLAKRPEKKSKSLFDELVEVFGHLTFGPKKEGSGEKATYKWTTAEKTEEGEREMVLTPGEREEMTEVENKLKKPLYRTVIRGVYVARRENWNPLHKTITRSYFSHFQTQNLNHIKFSGVTRPKTQYVFRERIPYLRTRRVFRNFIDRFTPLFPDRESECAILSTEELATLFHFPLKVTGLVSPTMTRVESKKGGPPPNLPM